MNTGQLYGFTANAVPDRDGGWFDSGWSCTEWMHWHKELVKSFGRNKANEMFVLEFDKQSSFDLQVNTCKYNSDFVKYFKSQGLNAGNVLSNLIINTGKVVDEVGGGANELAKGVNSTARTLKTFVPLLIAAVGIGGIYYLYKNYLKGNKKIKVAGVSI